jgi:hypothetical protein
MITSDEVEFFDTVVLQVLPAIVHDSFCNEKLFHQAAAERGQMPGELVATVATDIALAVVAKRRSLLPPSLDE